MTAALALDALEEDQHVVLRGSSWRDFEALLAMRGDRAGVRLYYLDGAIELMSPAKTHERRKTTLARLLETWALETGVDLEGFGSWTLKVEAKEAGAEPDECWILGDPDRDFPDLVLEVEWSRRLGIEKREIYRRFGVKELWTLRSDGRLVVLTRKDEQWVESETSALLPTLDLAWLVSFLERESQSQAVRALRDELLRARTA
jgi:Uma2 family endonuclease